MLPNRLACLMLPTLCAAATMIQSCADKPIARTTRDNETRQVATRCGLYKDAVAKDAVLARAFGHPIMAVDRYSFPHGTPNWLCTQREARKIGYELTYTWVMS